MTTNRKSIFPAPVAALAWMLLLILSSPCRSLADAPGKVVSYSVEIKASPDSVFRFLGKSANAKRWSVFVDHITPLNADSVPDGSPGSRRRCFCKRDESGKRWDETITEVIPGKKRRLSLYNMHGFLASSNSLATEQIYEPLEGGGCRLTFTILFATPPSRTERMKVWFAKPSIRGIFVKNMANIKRIVETGS